MAMQSTNTTVVMAPQQPATTTVVITEKEPNCCRRAIPALHIAGAVVACIFNLFIPGFGTILAGFFVFCCGNPGDSGGAKFGTCVLNFFIGLLQLVLSPFIIGWIWSWIWACAFIGMSADYHSDKTTTTVITTAPAQAPMVVTTSDAYGQQQQMPPPQQPMQSSGAPPPEDPAKVPLQDPNAPQQA